MLTPESLTTALLDLDLDDLRLLVSSLEYTSAYPRFASTLERATSLPSSELSALAQERVVHLTRGQSPDLASTASSYLTALAAATSSSSFSPTDLTLLALPLTEATPAH